MTSFLVILGWLIAGLIGSILAIRVYRPQQYVEKTELYVALFGPLAGPITLLLFVIDITKTRAYNGR